MNRTLPTLLAGLVVALAASGAFAQGMMVPRDQTLPPLALKSQQVQINIDNQVATTTVKQAFVNSTGRALEASYVFPLPADATIRDFALVIDGKRTSGELVEATKAKQIYTQIVAQARDPGLLEHLEDNLYRVSAFPVPANGTQSVELSYSQVVLGNGGVFRYTYPLHTARGASTVQDFFSIAAKLVSNVPLKAIYSPTHQIGLTRKGDTEAVIGLEENRAILDKDFSLYWTISNKDFGLNAVSYRPKADEPGYLMLLVSPKSAVNQKEVIGKDVVFVFDTSGSMEGEKIEQAKKALKFCVESLNQKDRFNIIIFNTDLTLYKDSLIEASQENKEAVRPFVNKLQAEGGTNIYEAIEKALSPGMYRDGDGANAARPRVIVFMTDGRPTVNKTGTEEILGLLVKEVDPKVIEKLEAEKAKLEKLLADALADETQEKVIPMRRSRVNELQQAIDMRKKKTIPRIFTFGVGDDVNTKLLDRIAQVSGGQPEYVRPGEDLEVKITDFFAKASHPVMTGLTLTFGGDCKVEQMFPTALPDLYFGQQVVALARYSGGGDVSVTLAGTISTGKAEKNTYEVNLPKQTVDNDFIEPLWAHRKVGYLLDQIRLNGENKELKDEVIRLSKHYKIQTPYTSYLVLEDQQRQRYLGNQTSNQAGQQTGPVSGGPVSMGGDFTFGGSSNLNMGTGAVTMTASPTVTVAPNGTTNAITPGPSASHVPGGPSPADGGRTVNVNKLGGLSETADGTLNINNARELNAPASPAAKPKVAVASQRVRSKTEAPDHGTLVFGGQAIRDGSTATATNGVAIDQQQSAPAGKAGPISGAAFGITKSGAGGSTINGGTIELNGPQVSVSNGSSYSTSVIGGESGLDTAGKDGAFLGGGLIIKGGKLSSYNGGTTDQRDLTAATGNVVFNGGSNSVVVASAGNNNIVDMCGGGSLTATSGGELLLSNNGIAMSGNGGIVTVGGPFSSFGGGTSGSGGRGGAGGSTMGLGSAGGTSTLALNGANTYTGSTTVNGGTLTLGSASALGPVANATITFGASSTGVVNLNGNNVTLNSLNTNGRPGGPDIAYGNDPVASDVLTVNNTLSNTYAGTLADGGLRLNALPITGNGSLNLSGANTFSGGLALTSGQLNINNATALGGAGGTLTIDGSGAINDNTSGAAVTQSKNNTVAALNGDLTYGSYAVNGRVGGSGGGRGNSVVSSDWKANGQQNPVTEAQQKDIDRLNRALDAGDKMADSGISITGGAAGRTANAGQVTLSGGNSLAVTPPAKQSAGNGQIAMGKAGNGQVSMNGQNTSTGGTNGTTGGLTTNLGTVGSNTGGVRVSSGTAVVGGEVQIDKAKAQAETYAGVRQNGGNRQNGLNNAAVVLDEKSLKAESGETAIALAKAINNLKHAESTDSEWSDRNSRRIGGRTFYALSGFWIDEKFDVPIEMTFVKWGGAAYFAIVTAHVELKDAFALGTRLVIVTAEGKALVVSDGDGLDKLTGDAEKQIKELFTPAKPAGITAGNSTTMPAGK